MHADRRPRGVPALGEQHRVAEDVDLAAVEGGQGLGQLALRRLAGDGAGVDPGFAQGLGDVFPGPTVYTETIGTVTAANGQTTVQLTTDMAAGSGSTQKLTIGGLSQAGTATVTFSAANTGPNTTTNVIQIAGATQTAAGQIIGPWATTTGGETDYAIYDAGGQILPAGLLLRQRTHGQRGRMSLWLPTPR